MHHVVLAFHADLADGLRRGHGAGLDHVVEGDDLGADSSSTDRGHPDMTIHLPGQKFLVLDTKAPMVIHLRACGIENSEENVVSQHRAELASHDYTRAHSSSHELVALFVPSEAALSATLRSGAVLNPTKNTTNTGHNELLSQDSLQPPRKPRQFPSLK